MSDLQRAWARSKLGLAHGALGELAERDGDGDGEEEGGREAEGAPPEWRAADPSLEPLPEHAADDDSSSASSVSSTGTIIPTPSQRLFARPEGYYLPPPPANAGLTAAVTTGSRAGAAWTRYRGRHTLSASCTSSRSTRRG